MSTVSKKTALASLRKLAQKAENIQANSPEHSGWLNGARTAIIRIFGNPSQQYREFNGWTTIERQRSILESFIAEIEDFWEDEAEVVKPPAAPVEDSIENEKVEPLEQAARRPCVFIGHGHSPVWARLQLFLEKNLGLDTISYESEPHAGESIVPILERMLARATFAVLILTAEDETSSGAKRARQNVIHEAGLFQGKLGFKKAILLRQTNTEDFSNIAGLQYISFEGDKIDQVFWELQQVLKREGQLLS